MRRLHLDFETRSTLDLKTVGLDRYAQVAEVLMLAWAFDDEEPELWLPDDFMPSRLTDGLLSTSVIKVAWNAAFEREIFKHALNLVIPVAQWLDPAVLARNATMPGSLGGICKYLNLGDTGKHSEGTRLISKFSKLQKRKGREYFNDPKDHPEDWALFQSYCLQDVRAERSVLHKLERMFSLTPFEERVAQIDAEINAHGIPVDMQFVQAAKTLVLAEKTLLIHRMRELTELENPNSNTQLLAWLRDREYPFSSLGKNKVTEALKSELPDAVREALHLRQKLSRSSTSKLDALIDRTGPDEFLRHSYKYLGAQRTGRWSGSGVQLQNLPR